MREDGPGGRLLGERIGGTLGRVARPDFTSWFAEDELERCPACRGRSGISVAETESFVCFACGYISWCGGETSVAELQGRRPSRPFE